MSWQMSLDVFNHFFHFLTGWMKSFAQTGFLVSWRIHKTLLKSSFRSRSDKNQPSKHKRLGIGPPVYNIHFDSCSKTAVQCKQLMGWNFSLRYTHGNDEKISNKHDRTFHRLISLWPCISETACIYTLIVTIRDATQTPYFKPFLDYFIH